MPEYQQRVVDERSALNEKIAKLYVFLNGQQSASLPLIEQVRLFRQLDYMKLYLAVVDERIAAF